MVRKLATGGMAEVFLARAAGPMGFEKTLVIKRILPHLAEDPHFTEMFLSEARLAARLSHANVVQIFDFGQEDDAYFIAMEYIDGPNLRTLSRRAFQLGTPIPFALCAKLISFACEGLAYAHELTEPGTGQPLNLIHRDISPDNILLSRNGGVKVVDFGIAKAATQLHRTRSGIVKGKLAYMPPEQLMNESVDARADVFSLGVVLYELVTGRKPYDAQSEVSLMRAILQEPMVGVRERRADVPEALVRIIEKALAKERCERYQRCRAMQLDLERYLISLGEPIGAFQLAELVQQFAAEPAGNDTRGSPLAESAPGEERPGATSPGPTRAAAPTRAERPEPTAQPPPPPAPSGLRSEAQVPTTILPPSEASEVASTQPLRPRSRLLPMALGIPVLLLLVGAGFWLGRREAKPAVPVVVARASPGPSSGPPTLPAREPEAVRPPEAAPPPPAEPQGPAPAVGTASDVPPPHEETEAPTPPAHRLKPHRRSEPAAGAPGRVAREARLTGQTVSARQQGTFQIRVFPDGATVWLDGKELGPAPRTVQVDEGLHRVKVVDPETLREYTQDVQVGPGDNPPFKHRFE